MSLDTMNMSEKWKDILGQLKKGYNLQSIHYLSKNY